ncbi:trimeric intracellular cation channel family protein [Pelagicoccus sp. NFK12]|uniref:Trimeric intracellular cation channel family protein n=1 Tax=Pelagicoccus enzymogenes TaxID=2773457 RepID=A0A927F8E0_9BACT|nr:trimeric intracellular cation channel family protein [Pelagicoccus enzymogenes]MBD5780187.1 trimeric intracellular cation channel family protein [Pelagicoccus enzymogenes]MDQ8198550.1 trimeric intracellular cation channel family protein [Pelagicoccus enzymogenes]
MLVEILAAFEHPQSLTYYLGQVGVAVFAISGALAADRKGSDWVGVLCLAAATGLGGGSLRDLLLRRESVFWIADTTYLWVVIAATAFTIFWVRFFKPPTNALLYADALGLAMFSIVGAKIAESSGVAAIIVVLMGVITGVAGGILRDVLANEIPLIFRASEPIYSVSSALGIIAYLGLKTFGCPPQLATLSGVAIIAATRFAAIIWKIKLPEFTIRKR